MLKLSSNLSIQNIKQNQISPKKNNHNNKKHIVNMHSFSVSGNALSNYNIAMLSFNGWNTPSLNYDYIKNIATNPRESYSKQEALRNQIGDNYYDWKFSDYKTAYSNFTERFYNEANSIDELIKIRPDWTGTKLREKFETLHPGEGLKFGSVPDSFINKETFEKLIDSIYASIRSQSYSSYSKNYDIPDISINNNTFTVKPLAGGRTSKVPCLVTTPDGKKYVVKIEPNRDHNYSDSLDSVDSVGMQAIIDYYLTQNDCENASKMYYYDDNNNASIYEYVEKNGDQSAILGMEKTLGNFVNKMTDLKALCVRFNDTMGDGNVFIRDGKIVMVDNGHCTYDNPLQPRVYGYHKELPNVLQFSCFMQ